MPTLPPPVEKLLNARAPLRRVNDEHQETLSPLERLAVFISDHVGTPGFFFLIILWTVFWLTWNFLAPDAMKFDKPMAFVFWLFISNMLQIFLMPLLMVAQNLQNRHTERRAQNDYEVNLKAEREVEAILRHLEYQNTLLQAVVDKLGLRGEELLVEKAGEEMGQ
jgi:uncharacterized membrane protein